MTLSNDSSNFSEFDKAEKDKASEYWDKILSMDNPLNQGEVISRDEELAIIAKARKGKSGLKIVKSTGKACHCKHGSLQHGYVKKRGWWSERFICKVKGCICEHFCSQHAWDNLK